MKAPMETSEILEKHAEMVAGNQARTIDGYVRLYLKKKPWYLSTKLYRYFLSKVLVLAYFKKK
jgi:hypothetical protein